MNVTHKAKKITRQEANEIIKDWNNSGKPYKRITAVWKGQWYDLRELSEAEINKFIYDLTGIKSTPENTANIEVNL